MKLFYAREITDKMFFHLVFHLVQIHYLCRCYMQLLNHCPLVPKNVIALDVHAYQYKEFKFII